MESVKTEGIFIIGCQACLQRQVESNPDTGVVFGLLVFIAHQAGPMDNRPDARGPLSPGLPQSPNHITHITLYRQRSLSMRALRVRELCRHDRDTSPANNQKRNLDAHLCSYRFYEE